MVAFCRKWEYYSHMEILQKNSLIKDILNILSLGVTQTSIASSMGITRQAFHKRLKKQEFTIDQAAFFYRKYKTLI